MCKAEITAMELEEKEILAALEAKRIREKELGASMEFEVNWSQDFWWIHILNVDLVDIEESVLGCR